MEVKVLRGTHRPVLGGTDASDQSEQEAEGKAEAGSVGGNPGRTDAARLAFYHLFLCTRDLPWPQFLPHFNHSINSIQSWHQRMHVILLFQESFNDASFPVGWPKFPLVRLQRSHALSSLTLAGSDECRGSLACSFVFLEV